VNLVRKKTLRKAMINVNVESEKASIRSLMHNCVKAVENSDIVSFGRAFAHDPDIVVIGTDASERVVGWEALKKAIQAQFLALPGMRITLRDVTVHLLREGRSAWATSLTVFKDTVGATGQEMEVPTRDTWVLEKRDKGWVILHVHHSVGRTG
jgi:uncharacterized protein (TIGR02246 family)